MLKNLVARRYRRELKLLTAAEVRDGVVVLDPLNTLAARRLIRRGLAHWDEADRYVLRSDRPRRIADLSPEQEAEAYAALWAALGATPAIPVEGRIANEAEARQLAAEADAFKRYLAETPTAHPAHEE